MPKRSASQISSGIALIADIGVVERAGERADYSALPLDNLGHMDSVTRARAGDLLESPGGQVARYHPMYLICIPVGMLVEEVLQYRTSIVNVTQGFFPNIPWVITHVSAMYC